MRIHILGICGAFMGGVAMIARQLGHDVTGSDAAVYPPMSNTLRSAGITILEGYDPGHLSPVPDMAVIGNAISRGNPALEYVLNEGIPYISGPQWLAEVGLKDRHVLAVSGTHGKTTTSCLLAWILETVGLSPGYLIGGVPKNFEQTARLGESKYFVIEADEYDTTFFDKRSKFIHYHPRTLILNNLEFDHADIFPDLAAIQRQFQFLLRTVPANGLIVRAEKDVALDEVIEKGCWSPIQTFGVNEGAWQARDMNSDGSQFTLYYDNQSYGRVEWTHCGLHNVKNALAAVAAAHHVGVSVNDAIRALKTFKGVKRRMEVRGCVKGVTVYDDFSHHPTAIETTLNGLRSRVGDQRIIVVLQFGSNTMRDGVHQKTIANSLRSADRILMLQPEGSAWDLNLVVQQLGERSSVHSDVNQILETLLPELKAEDHVLIMSNKGFDGIHQHLLERL